MRSSLLFILLSLLAVLVYAGDRRSWEVLESDNIQTGSQHDGLPTNNSIGYAPSATDAANFINYCSQRPLTNGKANGDESCNGVVMGDIPSDKNMVSTIITLPFPGQTLPAQIPFLVKFHTANLVSGSALQDGKVVGHVHVTIQSLSDGIGSGDQASIAPPDPARFVFFKTVFDTGDKAGRFSVPVNEGLPAGFYRVCTMVAASNHQPVVMPIVDRGAQDDCQKFIVAI
ncbi:hypothetical protein BJX61DRAFT_541888 [Aspergillus egyptiacus]|nr:hypothetical protein BJX61DRAFT_541888 [Aspergillus egyptiacus]